MRATEHAPRDRFYLLERLHALAKILERGASVVVKRARVNFPRPERDFITISVDPLIGLVCDDLAGAGQAAFEALEALDLPSIASRVQILQAENERLRARVEELEASQ